MDGMNNMNDIPYSYQQVNEPTMSNQVEQRKQQPQQMQLQPIIYYYCHPQTGQQTWQMIPFYYQYFGELKQFIEQAKSFPDKNWKPEQLTAYLKFLDDVITYIYTYVYTGYILYYHNFVEAMEKYGTTQNKLGYQLYLKQCDYFQKKSSGHDFKFERELQKQRRKEQNKRLLQQKLKLKQDKPKQQQVIIRKDDPTVTAEQLKSKIWENNKYTNINTFHLQSANLIFIGHVDSGKSTLTGNIMKQLKLIDQQQLLRNKQDAKEKHMESWQLAYIADIDPNQRLKGKTVQCSKLTFSIKHRRFTLFDAPGHKNYVPSMIMGACQCDIAVLILSAKQGQFQSGFEKQGQTKQHAMLAKALGVQSLIAVVTKMGLVNWSETRYKQIKQQVSPFLQNSCGFSGVLFIPIDSQNNLNIHSKYQLLKWYDGLCLIDVLDAVKIPQRDPDGPLRIPVVDKFRDSGQFYLYGKIQSGKIAYENQTVSVLPSRDYIVIKQIYNAKDEKLPYALAGQNVKLRVKGIEDDAVHRGDILCNNTNYCQQSMEFRAHLTVLELLEHKKIMSSGYECIIHLHAISEEAQISEVEAKEDKNTKKMIKATYLLPGEVGRVVVKLKNSVCLQKYDFMPSLGKFTLRDEGKTIGYGQVIKIKPAKTLTKEQKDQLASKKQSAAALNAEMRNINIEEGKNQEQVHKE